MGWKRKKLDAMGDEDFYDVHLVGRDGEEVPCCKAILGTTSPVFKAMFFKGFREQKSDRCSLDFHSLVISVIVKYCYCGEVDMDLIFSKNKSLGEEASLLIELREAGRYFEIDDLLSSAEAKIGSLVFQRNTDLKKYQYVSAFLTELCKRGQDSGPLWKALFKVVANHKMECIGPITPESNTIDTYYHAHPDVLARMFAQSGNAYVAVRCIQRWFSVENKSAGNGYSDEEKQNLIKVAENIDLRRLSTKQLSEISPCSLFSSDRILAAFVHHCKSSESITEKPRTKPKIYISGARIQYLNGVYMQARSATIYKRRVEHNGNPCFSIIHRRQAESKWLISITTNNTFYVNRNGEVAESSIQMHVYKSSGQSLPTTEDPNVLPPFNSWKCIQGTGSVPFVSFMYM